MQNRVNQYGAGAKRAGRGFTIIEIIVVIVIIGVLAAMIGPRLIGNVDKAKVSTAQANASTLATAVMNYRLAAGEYPSSLDDLWTMPSGLTKEKWEGGPYITNQDVLTDPWGHKYMLVVPGKKNADYDIVSYGADGVEGGEGVNADIIKP